MNLRIVFSRNGSGYPLLDENKSEPSFKDFIYENIGNGYLFVLSITDWDDFGYRTTFDGILFEINNSVPCAKVDLGKIKIGCKNFNGLEIIKNNFFIKYYNGKNDKKVIHELPDGFCSIPEDIEYYQLINSFLKNEENERDFLHAIKDISKNVRLLDSITDETFFKKSFSRTATFSMLEEFEWLNSDKHRTVFDKNFDHFKEILSDDLSSKSYEKSMYVMLHGFLIASLENYLYGRFYHTVMNSEELIFKQALNDPAVKDKTYTLKEIEKWKEDIKSRVSRSLLDKSFHNVNVVVPMYKEVLNIDFGGDIGWLYDAVQKRHDCAHRAGLDKNGKRIKIDKEYLMDLKERVKTLVNNIERQR